MLNSTTIKLTIESKRENVSLVGLAVRGICAQTPLNETDVFQVEVCVVEAVNNAIEHAYNGCAGHYVDVIISLGQNHISFQVCNTGKTFMFKKAAMVDFDPQNLDALPEGGMGLSIICTVMSEVAYRTEEGRNILTLCKYFGKYTGV